jgi:hypothetical protein
MPRVQMTRTTKFALFFLRFYLLVMLGLILYKFIQIIQAGHPQP